MTHIFFLSHPSLLPSTHPALPSPPRAAFKLTRSPVGSDSLKLFFKMAASPPSFDFPDADVYYSERMHVPQKITVPDIVNDDIHASGADTLAPKRTDMTSSMSIPERIVVNQPFSTPNSNGIPGQLRHDMTVLPGNNMGGMITPPQTLTVDDTVSAYYPRVRPDNATSRRPNEDSKESRIDADVDR